jgi:hypothetical protein
MALKPDPDVVGRWVEESCRAQGVEVKVTDPKTIEQVAVLLREGPGPASPAAGRAVRG